MGSPNQKERNRTTSVRFTQPGQPGVSSAPVKAGLVEANATARTSTAGNCFTAGQTGSREDAKARREGSGRPLPSLSAAPRLRVKKRSHATTPPINFRPGSRPILKGTYLFWMVRTSRRRYVTLLDGTYLSRMVRNYCRWYRPSRGCYVTLFARSGTSLGWSRPHFGWSITSPGRSGTSKMSSRTDFGWSRADLCRYFGHFGWSRPSLAWSRALGK